LKTFEYADGEVGSKEIMFAIPSMIIGVGILSLPRHLAVATNGTDGWISIFIAGLIVILFTWIIAKLASRFPKQSFYEYTSRIISRPLAGVLTFVISVHFLLYTAYEMRTVAFITKQYLLDNTPSEVIALVFLLIVIYAVTGERVGLLRLNMMFLPIILSITIVVAALNIPLMEADNFFPLFETSLTGYLRGTTESFFSFAGFEILLFYVALMNKPKTAPKYAVIGISFVIILYLIIQFATIGVFSYVVTSELLYPTIELAKEVEVPGGFFERFESVFFTIWIMALFNTSAMGYDIAVFALTSLFKKVKKLTIIFILAPVIYFIGMIPQDFNGINKFAEMISYSGIVISLVLPTTLFIIAKLRRIKGDG
jgi:spore germination protein